MSRVAVLTLLVTMRTFAQNAAAPPAFEVATIKPSDPSVRRPVGMFPAAGGRLNVTGESLRLMIREAYGVKDDQISGGPGWSATDPYDIVAKAGGDPANAQLMLMVQSLLADRFRLKLHRETREGPVFALVVGKNGPKLRQPKSGGETPNSETPGNQTPGNETWIRIARIGPFDRSAVSFRATAQNASMPLLAERLRDFVGRPVVDRTGIQGAFDFSFEFAPDVGQADITQTDGAASIFTAIQELGLRLESSKGPVELLIVDHAERPSGN